MKALINPHQDNFVVQIEEDSNIFEVATPLYWADCSSNIVPYSFKYLDNQFIEVSPSYINEVPPTKEELLAKLLEIQAQLEGL